MTVTDFRRCNMKTGGFTRKVDELGRVVFPIEIRRKLKIAPGDQMRIYLEGGSIIMKKDAAECVFCGSSKNLTEISGKHICRKCLDAALAKNSTGEADANGQQG